MNVIRRSVFTFASLLMVSPLMAEDDNRLAEIRAKVDEMFPNIDGAQVQYAPIGGWVTIQKGSIVAYMSEDGRYLMQGDLIDLDAGINLSENSRNHARAALIDDIDDNTFIVFSPEEVRHSITVFTDIDCTYCRRMHNEIDEYLDNGIEVRYLLYPRNGPRGKSWGTSEKVWCASDRNSALTQAKLDREFESHACDAGAVTTLYSLGREVGLTGTPALVFEDGTLMSGWMPAAALSDHLDQLFAADEELVSENN